MPNTYFFGVFMHNLYEKHDVSMMLLGPTNQTKKFLISTSGGGFLHGLWRWIGFFPPSKLRSRKFATKWGPRSRFVINGAIIHLPPKNGRQRWLGFTGVLFFFLPKVESFSPGISTDFFGPRAPETRKGFCSDLICQELENPTRCPSFWWETSSKWLVNRPFKKINDRGKTAYSSIYY